MKKTIFLLALASAGYASALEPGEYKNYTNEEAGGLLAVAPGEHVTVTDVTVHSGGTTAEIGGAVYVGEGGTFEIQGDSVFYENYEGVQDFEDLQGGIANDVYLAGDATLVLNPGEGKTVVLGSGVESSGNGAQLIKQGQGTAVLGGLDVTADYSYFDALIDVQTGELQVKTEVNASALSVSSGAGLQIQDNSLMLRANPDAMNALDVNAEGTEMSLSNVSVTLTELSALEEGTPGLISGGVINIGKKNYKVSDITLQNSGLNIHATGCVLTGIAMDAGSTIDVSNGSATLGGENSLLLGGLTYDGSAWVSTQLSGVTLADGATLTLGLTGEQLAEMEVEFTVELKEVTVADGASVTLATGSLGDTSTGLTIVSWTQGSTSLLVEMQQSSLVVPEPATATLSLLALAALAARRRREM